MAGRLERSLPWLFAGAATVGLIAPDPGRAAADARGIDAALTVLVFASALTVSPGGFRRAAAHGKTLSAVVLLAAVILPGLAWAVSRLVPAGDLRHGVLTLAVAPVEVAAVAITAIVRGAVAATAVMLVGSTLVAVLAAGPVLGLFAAGAVEPPVKIVADIALIVAAPLTIGLVLRATPAGRPLSRVADAVAVAAVTVLAWLVASQIQLSADYATAAAAIALFLAGSVALGWLATRSVPPTLRSAVMLSTSMRDFAVAAGIATAAFGPRAAGPLGLYGIAVLAWGAIAARYPGLVRHSPTERRASSHPGIPPRL